MPAEKSKILRRLPFVVKVVLLTVISGTVVGIVSDRVADMVVNDIFEKHLQNMLEEQSQEDRLRFDHYLKDFHQVSRLTAEHRPFLEYVKKSNWPQQTKSYTIEYKTR